MTIREAEQEIQRLEEEAKKLEAQTRQDAKDTAKRVYREAGSSKLERMKWPIGVLAVGVLLCVLGVWGLGIIAVIAGGAWLMIVNEKACGSRADVRTAADICWKELVREDQK